MSPYDAGIAVRPGVELPGLGLWLDPRRSKALAFVSHAHSDHIARHREVIASAATLALMRARLSGERVEHAVGFGEPFSHPGVPGARLTLYPAGHIPGSAQLLVEAQGGSLLYSGDFKLRAGRAAEPATVPRADTVVMETTFGRPRYRFPPLEEVLTQVVAFCREALAAGEVPVLLAYSLGKAQEALWAVAEAGLPVMVHKAIYRMNTVCREVCPGFPQGYRMHKPGAEAGYVVLHPPGAGLAIARRRVAVLTGWALDGRVRYQSGADAAFPLSDHADYGELLRYVELAAPRRVFTIHGFAAEFARDLRSLGVEAWPLEPEAQPDLPMRLPVAG